MKLAKATMYILTPKLDWLNVLISLNGLLLIIFNFLQPLFLFMGGDWMWENIVVGLNAKYGWNCS